MYLNLACESRKEVIPTDTSSIISGPQFAGCLCRCSAPSLCARCAERGECGSSELERYLQPLLCPLCTLSSGRRTQGKCFKKAAIDNNVRYNELTWRGVGCACDGGVSVCSLEIPIVNSFVDICDQYWGSNFVDIVKDYYLHNRARKWFMTFPQFLSSSSNTE